MSEEKTYYNHAFDMGFTVMSTDPEGATTEEILFGMRRRLACLEADPSEVQEACGCYDPSEEPYTEQQYHEWQKQFDGGELFTVIEVIDGIPQNARTLPEKAAEQMFSELAQANGAGEPEVQDLINQHGYYANGNYTVGIVQA